MEDIRYKHLWDAVMEEDEDTRSRIFSRLPSQPECTHDQDKYFWHCPCESYWLPFIGIEEKSDDYWDKHECSRCDSMDAKLVRNPYVSDVHDEVVYQYICDKCYQNLLDDI